MTVDWDTTWMNIAHVMTRRSGCGLTQVGAVVVDRHNRIVATGYNGPPTGWVGVCTARGNMGCARYQNAERGRPSSYGNCISIHAEANALLFCDRKDREGGTIYVTCACCWDCAKLVANSGLARVVMIETDADLHREPAKSRAFLKQSGLEVVVWQK